MKNIQTGFKFLIIIFCVLSAIFIAYHDALNNGFLTMWDTQAYVINNANIKALNWDNIQWMFTSFYMSNWHPLTWLSHALDYAWFGLEPKGHHLVSLIIHCFNSVLLFFLVMALMFSRWAHNKILLVAGISATFFGIHPQHVESVVWIAERKDVLCLFFILLALLFYVFYVRTARLSWYLSTLLCFILALLAKPMAVTFPVILLLMDVYPLNRISQQRISMLVVEKIPFFIFTLFSVIITVMAQHHGGAISSLDNLDLQIRLLNAFNSLVFYLSKFIFPIGLSPFYPLDKSFYESYPSLIPVIACFLITVVCGYFWTKKKYYWLMAWLFYLVTLSPVIGIIQVGIQAAADRYVYLPTIPLYILLAIGIVNNLYNKKVLKIIKLGIVFCLFFVGVMLIQLTQKHTLVWKNDLTFWGHIVAYAPESPLGQKNLGDAYFRIGEYEKAIEHYHLAGRWQSNLPMAYIKLNRLEEALNFLNGVIEYNIEIGHHWDNIYYMRGMIYFKQGLLQQAQESLTKALEINHKNKGARDFLLKIQNH